MDSKNKAGQREGGSHAKQAGHPAKEQVHAGTSMERQQAPKTGELKQKEGHPKTGKK
jgi:hypothetical protein